MERGTLNLIICIILTFLIGCKNPLSNDEGSSVDNTYHPGIKLSLVKSKVSVASASILSGNSTTISIQLNDDYGNAFIDPQSVTITADGGTGLGTVGTIVNQGNGLYTTSFVGSVAGTALTIHGFVNGEAITSALPTITILPGNYSLSLSTVSIFSGTLTSGNSTQVTLVTKDSNGNQLSSGGLTITFSLSGGTSSGSFSAVTDNNDGTYSATFTGTTSGSASTLHAQIMTQELTSALPTVTVNPGAASQLTFTTGPSNATAGSSINTLVVKALDAAGNIATSFSSNLSIAISANPGSGVLSGAATVAAVSGVASFANLSINKVGTGYTLVASSSGLTSATSSSFNITPGAPATISVNSGNAQSGYVSEALASAFVAVVKDANSNVVPSATVDWAVTTGGGSLSSASNTTDASGLSSSTLTLGSSAGANTVSATVHGTAIAVSFSATASLRALTITSISPATTFLEGGKTVTITGTGFYSTMTVSIGGSSCSSVSISSLTQLTCVNPMHSAGAVNVVLNRFDTASATLSSGFTYSSTLFTNMVTVNGAATHGASNGTGTAARFYHPMDIVANGTTLYVSDTQNNLIRQIDTITGAVTDVAGVRGYAGNTDGAGSSAKFNGPTGLAINGNYLYVSNTDSCTIRRIDLTTNVVSTWAGQANTCLSSTDGTSGTGITFSHPWGLTADSNYLYVVDSIRGDTNDGNLIRKIDFATATITTLAGNGSCNVTNGSGTSAQFCAPVAIAQVGTNLYIGDTYYYVLRKLDISGSPAVASTFAGTFNSGGSTDGVGTAAKFSRIGDIVSDGTSLYIANAGGTIRKVDIATATVSTVVGTAGSSGYVNGIGTAARLKKPTGMAIIGNTIYFADSGNNAIRIYDIPSGIITTLAGFGG